MIFDCEDSVLKKYIPKIFRYRKVKYCHYFYLAMIFFMCTHYCMASNIKGVDAGVIKILSKNNNAINYDILSKGKKIGSVTHRVILTNHGYTLAEISEVNVSGWWGKININSNFVDTYDIAGKLLSSDNKIRDGETIHHLTTNLEKVRYQASYRKFKKTTGDERYKFNQLNEVVKKQTTISSSTVINLSNAIFANRMKENIVGRFSEKMFDTTLAFLPIFLNGNLKEVNQRKIKIYDTEKLEITHQKVVDLGWENVLLNGVIIKTRHLSLTEDKKVPSHLWIANFSMVNISTGVGKVNADHIDRSLPILVRLTAEDEDGPVEITIR